MYSFCMEPQPNTCQSLSEHELVSTTVLSQCTNSTKELIVTTYLPTLIYTPSTIVQMTVCPSSTTSFKSQMMEKTNVFSTTSFTNTTYPSPTHSLTPETCTSMIQIVRSNTEISVTGALVGLLVVLLILVTTGWVYTCSRKTGSELRSQNIRYTYYILIRNLIVVH